ncbi:MAG: hypothetical protein C4537_07780 [Acholeplasma sp.]|jgi:hypothetical protein|nr:MAG: hypothetical protein C4537_07780 [Acholeplasma sp.]
MSKKPLSKQVGLWDNAQNNSELQQTENSIGEIKRCLNKDSELQKMINNGKLLLKVRGSVAKSTNVTEASDLDLHLIFSKDYKLKECKDYVHDVLIKGFGNNDVTRKDLAISVKPSINRVSTDILVCKVVDDDRVDALSDTTKKEVPFYPTIDEKNINQLNAGCANNYSKMVRTYKGLKNEMFKSKKYNHYITSFMIECLIYNVNHTLFDIARYINEKNNELKYKKMFLDIKATIFSVQLNDFIKADEYREINGKKKLFENKKHWETVKDFFLDVNDYLREEYDVNL